MRKFLKNNSGVTMMEVLITVAILAIVVVPCLSSFVVAQRGNVLARQTADTYTQASNLIETLKGEEVTETWSENILNAVNASRENTADGITAFAEIPKDKNYVIVYVYAGDLEVTEKPEDTEPILKGVIAP